MGMAAALEAPLITLQADTAPKELNDLRAFRAPDMHQAHGADAPAVPAFNEFLRADKQIDR